MSDLPFSEEDVEAVQKEYNDLRSGVATAALAWAAVENASVKLLTAILNKDNMRIVAAMYFSVPGIDARLGILSSAFDELIFILRSKGMDDPVYPHLDKLAGLWSTLSNRLKRLKKARNKVAHGQIVFTGNTPLVMPRLTSPVLDFGQFRSAHSKGVLPGMSSNDVRVHAHAVERAAECLCDFEKCVRLIDRPESLHERLALLEAAILNQDSPHTQTQLTPQPPPPSSQR